MKEFVYDTFNAFAKKHPWTSGDNIRPKSIAREMVERFFSFNEYVSEYELARAEGVLLRYLSEAYKALVQTVPAAAKTPETEEIEVFLGAMVRAVDASLLEEWERLRHAEAVPSRTSAPGEAATPSNPTSRRTSAPSPYSSETRCSRSCARCPTRTGPRRPGPSIQRKRARPPSGRRAASTQRSPPSSRRTRQGSGRILQAD